MRLVTTLLAASAGALEAQARLATTSWVEVRLDALAGLQPGQLPDLRRRVRQRAIATCRAAPEGGRFRGSEAEREALLRAAVGAGFDAVDVEADARFLRRLAEEARRAGAELIVSRHELAAASAAAGVEEFLRAVPAHAVAKYAAGVEGPGDLAALVEACALARRLGRRFAVMGLGDASLRLLAPLLGCELVYCAPPEGPLAAPGQLPAEVVREAHAALPGGQGITARHRVVALLGDPVEHSLSPPMQNAAFAAQGDALVYVALRTPAARLRSVLRGLRAAGFAGANVTTPLKELALDHVDRLDAFAREARAVNTLAVRNGRVVGFTTDGTGALAALREAGAEPRGAVALVLGAGGAGRAVVHALGHAGAEVLVANRTVARARTLARQAGAEAIPWQRAALQQAAARARVLVNCTAVGRDGRGSPLPAALLHEKLTVLDAVYRAGGTPLVRAALRKGCAALPGEALLLHQGAQAYQLWTGEAAPLGVMRSALLAAREAGP